MKTLSIVILAALVAGCSSPTTRWVKGGTTVEDLRLDQDECAARSSSYDFAFEDRDTGRGADPANRRAGSARGDVYRQCMETRGWRRERGGQAPQ